MPCAPGGFSVNAFPVGWRLACDMLRTTHRRRGRPAGMTPDRIRKRYIIATGLILGLKVVEIACQIGVSRSWASREANSAGVRNIIAELIRENWEQIQALFSQALSMIRDTMQARTVLRHKGRLIQGGPDHRVRFAAVRTFMKLVNAAGQVGLVAL